MPADSTDYVKCDWCRQDGCTDANSADCPCPHHAPATDSVKSVEAVVQEAIDEWATIAGGPDADEGERVPLAHYITSKLLWRFGK